MITDKAKRLYKRVQALFDNISDQGTVSSLERDLMLSYLRDLYDELSGPATHVSEVKEKEEFQVKLTEQKVAAPEQKTPEQKTPEQKTPEQKSVNIASEWLDQPVRETARPANVQAPKTTPVQEQPSYTPSYETIPSAEKLSREPVSTHGVLQHEDDHSLTDLFEMKQVGELSEKLKMQPVDRIEHGMGINERILTVNELFNGSNELFRNTLDHLNGLQTFSEAKFYLINGVASQYKWADVARKKKAQYFIQIIRRKYIGN